MVKPQRLSHFFVPRPQGWLQAERRHSRRVALWRIALPTAAALLLSAVFLWPVAEGRRIIAMPPTPAVPQLIMQQPHFTGMDEQNRPYSLRATQAVQQPDNLQQTTLVAPQAQFTDSHGQPVQGRAAQGRFDQAKKQLWLGGGVILEQIPPASSKEPPLTFTTQELHADLAAKTAWSDQPTRLTGRFGSIEGQGFRVYEGGKVLLFTGASRAILLDNGAMALPVLGAGSGTTAVQTRRQ